MTEAVLIHLNEVQVRQFFALVADHFAGALLVFDSMAPSAAKNQHRHEVMRYYKARFQWGIRDIRSIMALLRRQIAAVASLGDYASEYHLKKCCWRRRSGPFTWHTTWPTTAWCWT